MGDMKSMRALCMGIVVMMMAWGAAWAAQEEIFLIESFEDLERFSAMICESGEAYRGEARLMNDIEAERQLQPIGDAEHMFQGVFDGQGHTVSGLRAAGAGDFSGLFGFIGREGIVRNLTVRNVLVTGGRYTGAVAGYSAGVIEGCAVSGGRVIGTGGYEYGAATGGIAGLVDGQVENCANLGADVYGSRFVGGIAGSLCAGSIRRCLNTGDVYSPQDGEALAGGVVGAVQSGGEVRECVSGGKVFAGRAFDVGGIAGGVMSGSLIRCAFQGRVYGREAGAVAGYAAGRAQVMGCLYDAAAGRAVGEGRQDGTLPLPRRVGPVNEEILTGLVK